MTNRRLMRLGYVGLMYVVCGLPTSVNADNPKTNDPSAMSIYLQLVAKYRECRTYRDTGVGKVIYHSNEGDRVDESPFTTAFVRNSRYRLEYGEVYGADKSKKFPYIIWTDGSETRKWRETSQEEEKPESLATALLNAHGSTFHVSTTIPTLLGLSSMTWFPPSEDQLKKLPDEKIGDVDCFRIQIVDINRTERTLWIAKESHLLRRFDVLPPKSPGSEFWFEVTVSYSPVVDESIPDEQLKFK